MKSELKTDILTYTQIINREYWTCYNPDHHHTTKEIAEKCIFNHERLRKQYSLKWTKDMYRDILKLRHDGLTLKDIGIKYGVQSQRIRDVEAKALRMKRKGFLP